MPKTTEQTEKQNVRFGDALTRQRERAGYAKQADAANASVSLAREDTETFESFSQQWLSRLESDKTGERIDAANRRRLRTLSYLLGWSGSEFEIHVGVPVGTVPRLADTAVAQLGATLQHLEGIDVAPPLIKLPVFDSLVDGVRGFDSGAEPGRYQYVVQSELPEGVNVSRLYFAVVSEMDLFDESLEPTVPVGAQLLIEARKTPKVGQLIVAHLPERDLGVITRFSKGKENVLFRSYQVGGEVVWSSRYPNKRIGGVVRHICFEP